MMVKGKCNNKDKDRCNNKDMSFQKVQRKCYSYRKCLDHI